MYVLGTQYSNPHSCFQTFVVCVHRHTLCDCVKATTHTQGQFTDSESLCLLLTKHYVVGDVISTAFSN